MYHRSTVSVDGGVMFYRHTDIDPHRKTLLFLHGLGDSGLAFIEAFHEPGLREYNIIVPDLLGYGKSKPKACGKADYRFNAQIARLYALLDHLKIDKFFVVGHSMGGDIGTLMCDSDRQARIQAFVNIEGDLTEGDRFITNKVRKAKRMGCFRFWLRHTFTNKIVLKDWAKYGPSRLRYLDSLRICRPKAFLKNAEEIYDLNATEKERTEKGRKRAIIAAKYEKIPVPTLFCWGTDTIWENSPTWCYLDTKPFRHKSFDAFHWIMLDQPRKFYDYLIKFLHEVKTQKL